MATRQQGGRGNQQQDDQEQNVIVESQQIRRIRVGEIAYETTTDPASGEEHIKVSGQGIEERTLNSADIDQLSRFFSRNVRFNASIRRNGHHATDGRGQVNHPETDSRLKGNEDLRPSDPGGARRAGQQ